MGVIGSVLLVLAVLETIVSLQLRPVQSSMSLIEELTDSRVAYPPNLDYNELFCYTGAATSSSLVERLKRLARVAVPSQLPSKCFGDSDCASFSSAPFCTESAVCGQCRTDNDCANTPETPMCHENVCSACVSDSDCGSGDSTTMTNANSPLICRSVDSQSPVKLNPRLCVPCGKQDIPLDVTMNAVNSCSFTCPSSRPVLTSDQDGNDICGICPTCLDGQFMVPVSDFESGTLPVSFYPTCSMARDPKCIDCPLEVTDNNCATVLAPNQDYSNDTTVGRLKDAATIPCSTFRCTDGWFLDTSIQQCRQCQLRSCPSGMYLAGCGGSSAGTCAMCPQLSTSEGERNLTFIDPRNSPFQIVNPIDVCKPQCDAGEFLTRQSSVFTWSCVPCQGSNTCTPGQFFTGCGPDANAGQCQNCPNHLLPNWYWSQALVCFMMECDFSVCSPGTVLSGCGDLSGGACQPCPFALPPNAVAWASALDQTTMQMDTCKVVCRDGFYLNPADSSDQAPTCEPCAAADSCPVGQLLVGCSATSAGYCQDCASVEGASDFFFDSNKRSPTSPCATSACDLNSCGPGNILEGCGGASPGQCMGCGRLPDGAARWIEGCDVECKENFHLDGSSSSNAVCVASSY